MSKNYKHLRILNENKLDLNTTDLIKDHESMYGYFSNFSDWFDVYNHMLIVQVE